MKLALRSRLDRLHWTTRCWLVLTVAWCTHGFIYAPWARAGGVRYYGGVQYYGCPDDPKDLTVDIFMEGRCNHAPLTTTERLSSFLAELAEIPQRTDFLAILVMPAAVLAGLFAARWVIRSGAQGDSAVIFGAWASRHTFLLMATLAAFFVLVLLWRASGNGRYAIRVEGGSREILDTRTGILYRQGSGGWVEYNPQTGRIVEHATPQ
jgi:hypothetical protein